MRRIIQVTETDSGQRIDKLLSQQLPELTRSPFASVQDGLRDHRRTAGQKKCESSCPET